MQQQFDIIIVGAGLVGVSLINALAGLDLKIAVLDKKLPTWDEPSNTDQRPLSLTYGSKRILSALHLWPYLAPATTPIQTMQLSYKGHLGTVNFTADDYHVEALGYIIPYHTLYKCLYEKASSHSNVQFYQSSAISSIKPGVDTTIVCYKDPTGTMVELSCRLLVAADGTQSTCRSLLNISVQQEDQGGWAHVFNLSMSTPHDNDAYQRWTPHGSLAVLPLNDRSHRRMVWTVDRAFHTTLSSWDATTINDYINNIYALKIGSSSHAISVGNYPLKWVQANSLIASRSVLLGNAAHTIYPLSAQGFNLGLKEAALLAEQITNELSNREDIGSKTMLQHYSCQINADLRFVRQLTQHMHSAFSLNIPFSTGIRSMSLLTIDMLPFLKNKLAKQLMGISGTLSKLACGISLETAYQQDIDHG